MSIIFHNLVLEIVVNDICPVVFHWKASRCNVHERD